MLKGLLLKESLKDQSVLERVRITKTETWTVDNAAEYQPPIWTAIWFETEDDQAEAFTQMLSQSFHEQGWYANASTDTLAYVIFPGKVFCYPKGDAARRAAAQQFALTIGVPASQLDWGD